MNEYKNTKNIAILLASYNGAKYIEKQIDSIIEQTYKNWTLFIRDDGSTDGTRGIIEKYVQLYDNIIFIKDNLKGLGAAHNFMKLLEYVESEYYMFCDQDDIWLPHKIEKEYATLKADENKKIPTVVHTDAIIADANLNILSGSYWNEIHIDPDKLKTYDLMALCSYCQGSTMLFNKVARDISIQSRTPLLMHDWWVGTRVLRNGGTIISIKEPTILYRQHSNNVSHIAYGNRNTIVYKLRNIQIVISNNIKDYKILKADEYGSILKFLIFKIKLLYHMKILKKTYKVPNVEFEK